MGQKDFWARLLLFPVETILTMSGALGVHSFAQVGAVRLWSNLWFCPPLIAVKGRRVAIMVAVV